MKIWTSLDRYLPSDPRPVVLALGNFDGVHRGHQSILSSVVKRASKKKGIASVLTFLEHPQRVLRRTKDPSLLTSPQHRLYYFEKLGVEQCFLLHFTMSFSKTSPEKFVEEWLVKRLRVSEVHLGYNAHFGLGRGGDGAVMKRLAGRLGFEFHEAEPVTVSGEFVSSSLIRDALRKGDFTRAEHLLGRPFGLFATVVRGKGRGRNLGFPTANLRPHSEILPPRGVYPIRLREHPFHLKAMGSGDFFEYVSEQPGAWFDGILNLGVRPTFGEAVNEEIPEAHLFGFEGHLYGKSVEVVFYPRLREERSFPNTDELIQAIRQDVAKAQEYFRDSTHAIEMRS